MDSVDEPTAKRKEPRWSNLPRELVEAILRALPLEDYNDFGLVCKPWWSAMVKVRALFKPPPLLILKPCHPCQLTITDPGNRAREAEATRFYAICEGGRFRRLSIRLNARCCGSSMGWLFMVDINDGSRVHLLDPISGEKVELPPLPPQVTLSDSYDVLCSKPAPDRDCIVAIYRILINAEGPVQFRGLLSCRPKDDRWGEIRLDGGAYSVAFYAGRLYVGEGLDVGKGHVKDIYDFDPDPRKVGSVELDDGCETRDLVVMDGKLLVVGAVCPNGTPAGERRVYEYDNDGWVKIQSPSDWVLLRNRFMTLAFSTKESPTLGFEANSIYQLQTGALYVYSMEGWACWNINLPRAETGSANIASPFQRCLCQGYWFCAQSW